MTRGLPAAVAAAQGYMAQVDPALRVDGIWSNRTHTAYSSLTGEGRLVVDSILSTVLGSRTTGTMVYGKRNADRIAGTTALERLDVSSTSTSTMKAMISAIAQQEGVEPELALRFASVESRFNPNAVSPSGASGLFQLTAGAIADVGLPPPGGNRLDPQWNARVGIKYMKIVARRLNVPLTMANSGLIYAGYNVGTGTVKELQEGKVTARGEKLIGYQAEKLKRGGATQYLANAQQFVSTAQV